MQVLYTADWTQIRTQRMNLWRSKISYGHVSLRLGTLPLYGDDRAVAAQWDRPCEQADNAAAIIAQW